MSESAPLQGCLNSEKYEYEYDPYPTFGENYQTVFEEPLKTDLYDTFFIFNFV